MTLTRGSITVDGQCTRIEAGSSLEVHGALKVTTIEGELTASGRAAFLELNHQSQLPRRWPWLDSAFGDWLRMMLPAATGTLVGAVATVLILRRRAEAAAGQDPTPPGG